MFVWELNNKNILIWNVDITLLSADLTHGTHGLCTGATHDGWISEIHGWHKVLTQSVPAEGILPAAKQQQFSSSETHMQKMRGVLKASKLCPSAQTDKPDTPEEASCAA